MKLGVRAHDLGKLPAQELADLVVEKGFSSIQLAPFKAIEGVEYDTDILEQAVVDGIKQVFENSNIEIAILGCYINPVHPDVNERKKQLQRFKEHIAFAAKCGYKTVGTETGGLNDNFPLDLENRDEIAFETLKNSVKELVEEGEKFGVNVAIEGVARDVISTPQVMKRLVDSIPSPCLKVILDPVNLINNDNYSKQDDIIKQSFELFGDKIVAIHSKDFKLENGNVRGVPTGEGILNYPLLMDLLKQQKQNINFLFEDINVNTVSESIRFISNF